MSARNSALDEEAARRAYEDTDGLAAEIGAMVPAMPVEIRRDAVIAAQNGCAVFSWRRDDVEYSAHLQPAVEILYHRKLRALLDDPEWRPSDAYGRHRMGPYQ